MISILPSIKQSPGWASYLKTLGWSIVHLKDGTMVPIYKTKFGSIIKIQRPLPLTSDSIQEIDKLARDNKALFVKLEPGLNQDVKLLTDSGYVESYAPLSVPSTILLDLSKSKEDLWNQISHSGKYSINRAKREGGRIDCFVKPTDDQLKEHQHIMQVTGNRKGFYVQPLAETLVKRDFFGDDSFLIFGYDKEGRLCSSKFILGFDGVATYISGGTSPAGLRNKVGYLLMWEAISFLKERGFKIFDLEGKNDPRYPKFTSDWGGFSHFKEKYGGVSIEFPPSFIKYFHKVLRLASKIGTLPL